MDKVKPWIMKARGPNLVILAMGYKVNKVSGISFDEEKDVILNNNGLIEENIYVTGWAANNTVGVIGTNKIDADRIAKLCLSNIRIKNKKAKKNIKDVLKNKKIKFISMQDWEKIDQLEIKLAKNGLTRRKFTNVKEILLELKF